ncbi:MAG: hypothetical protein Q7S45_01280 [Candidatus Curtissbacteria bacterium]|nr:hypothetical protein [Candidatus Curtissbacteria bacterium]
MVEQIATHPRPSEPLYSQLPEGLRVPLKVGEHIRIEAEFRGVEWEISEDKGDMWLSYQPRPMMRKIREQSGVREARSILKAVRNQINSGILNGDTKAGFALIRDLMADLGRPIVEKDRIVLPQLPLRPHSVFK